jgi:hypothetical protein
MKSHKNGAPSPTTERASNVTNSDSHSTAVMLAPQHSATLTDALDMALGLLAKGRCPLPVAPTFPAEEYPVKKDGKLQLDKDGNPKPAFTGKNPSYLDTKGIPHLINHKCYQNQCPTDVEVRSWFSSPSVGIGELCGFGGLYWVDWDTKHFDSPEALEASFTAWQQRYPQLANAPVQRTHSGGFHLQIELATDPGFTNFALTPGGPHIGELLGEGRFCVLAPTIGPSGKAYEVVVGGESPVIEDPIAIGIYASKKPPSKTQRTPTAKSKTPSKAIKQIALEALGTDDSRDILGGKDVKDDRSDSLTTAIREWAGWKNWCLEKGVAISGDVKSLAEQAGDALGVDADRVHRILGSIGDLSSCLPACVADGSDTEAWRRVRKLEPGYKEVAKGKKAAKGETGDSDDSSGKRSMADRLLDLAKAAGIETFTTHDGIAYADISTKGVRRTLPLRRKEFRMWLDYAYYTENNRSANSDALTQAINTLESKTHHESDKRDVFVRVAEHDGHVYIDLGNDDWEVVKVGPEGWCIVRDAPVRFQRNSAQLPLPTPIGGGGLDNLKSFLGLSFDNWVIVLLWLIQAIKPEAEYPILVLTAPPGTGKSAITEALKTLIDPAPVLMIPSVGDIRNHAVTCKNRHVIAIDNLSSLTADQSDILCRASTGGGFSHRTLNTDSDETTISFLNPQILNGIESIVTRGDLLARSFLVGLTEPTTKLSRTGFKNRLEELHPTALGGLIDLLSKVLAVLPSIKGSVTLTGERFMGFVEIGLAVEKVLEWDEGTVTRVLGSVRELAHETAVEASPVASAIRDLVESRSSYKNTPSELLIDLTNIAPDGVTRSKYWPVDATRLSKAIIRLKPDLEAIGITADYTKSNGNRSWTLERKAPQAGAGWRGDANAVAPAKALENRAPEW